MRMKPLWTGALAAGLLFCALCARAEPVTPTRDDEVIEVLPAAAGNRDEDRRLRKELAARPDDAALAVRVALRYLERAREGGDPRFAGLALAALRPWPDAVTAPGEVLLMRATCQARLGQTAPARATLKLAGDDPAFKNERMALSQRLGNE